MQPAGLEPDSANCNDDIPNIYTGITTNFGELGKSIGDSDVGQIRYFKEPLQMYELLGFSDTNAGVPYHHRHWTNIIPEGTLITDRSGVVISGDDITITEDDQQTWTDGSYYPVLPKLNKFGKFDESLGLQGSHPQDDPGGYQFTAWIVGGIVLNDGVQMGGDGDMFAAFDAAGNVRGVAVELSPPFGPYEGTPVWEMTMRSNADGDVLSFQYYDASEDVILGISETYTFVNP